MEFGDRKKTGDMLDKSKTRRKSGESNLFPVLDPLNLLPARSTSLQSA